MKRREEASKVQFVRDMVIVGVGLQLESNSVENRMMVGCEARRNEKDVMVRLRLRVSQEKGSAHPK